MLKKLLPERSFQQLRDIKASFLQQEGIRVLMLDFDNTIMAYPERLDPPWFKKWYESIREVGIRVCVVTNSRKPKARDFCRRWNIPIVSRARKPSPRALERVWTRYHVSREQCAMVGDQIFTDIRAANRGWFHAYLVEPILNHNLFLKARYRLQKIILNLAIRRYRT